MRVLFGSGAGAAWKLEPGPRLPSGGRGPVGITVRDQTGDGIPDLVVANKRGNTLSTLAGVGGGLFQTRSPAVRVFPGLSAADAPVPPAIDPATGIGFAVGAGNQVLTFGLNSPTGAATPEERPTEQEWRTCQS